MGGESQSDANAQHPPKEHVTQEKPGDGVADLEKKVSAAQTEAKSREEKDENNVEGPKDEIKEISEEISSDSKYEEILGEETKKAHENGEEVSFEEIQARALLAYYEKLGETQGTTQGEGTTGKETSLSDEQKRDISEVFRKGFRNHGKEMKKIANQTIQLANERVKQAKLKADPDAQETEMAQMSEKIAKLETEYEKAFKEFEDKFKSSDPRLTTLTKDSLENDELLKLLEKERKRSLVELLLASGLTMLYASFAVGKDTLNVVKEPLS